MQWKELTTVGQFDQILKDSFTHPVAVFKHSIRCGTSSVAMHRIERNWRFETPAYLVDVIHNRQVSDYVAEKLGITHESPQFILLKDGKSVYDASHLFISLDEVGKRLEAA